MESTRLSIYKNSEYDIIEKHIIENNKMNDEIFF